MGSYCDSCYCLHGSKFEDTNLQEYADHDLCTKCLSEISMKVNDMIKEHTKGNIIKGVGQ